MTSFHRKFSISTFDDLEPTYIAEVESSKPVGRQIEEISSQICDWSTQWHKKARFFRKDTIPLGIKIMLAETYIKNGWRFCIYQAVFRS